MRRLTRRGVLALAALAPVAARAAEPTPDGASHRLELAPGGFRLDGAPFRILAGEMHPARIPRSEWPARIAMARAMGLNTISIYLMWNAIEPQPGVFDSSGRQDIAAFLRLCAQAGLWVYLRPGPYVCAEWDLGGLPGWLLFDHDIALRTRDPRFLAACERYIAHVAAVVRPFLAKTGGPILMTQVENEYASFGTDTAYLAWIRACWQRHGITGLFSIADGLTQLQHARTVLPDCAIGLDGDDDAAGVATLAPGATGWISEAYPGWLTHWGDARFASAEFDADLRRILAARTSFSLYVVHGGTNFGLTAGANAKADGSAFQPVITSYDYGAPIDETGAPTAAFHRFRAMIAQSTGRTPPPVPDAPPMTGFAPVPARRAGSIRRAWRDWHHSDDPMSLERGQRQSLGMALYRTTIPAGAGGELHLPMVRDHARFFLDGADLGSRSRLDPSAAPLTVAPADRPRRLDILIDTFGHVGYGHALGEHKGIEGAVHLGALRLRGWAMSGLPLDAACVARLHALPPEDDAAGCLFAARFTPDRPGAGTYVDMSDWEKGYVWVNANALGRFDRRGPQQRLFCPAEFLRPGGNEVLVLDLHRPAPATLRGRTRLAG
ncbi:beta-galactosidase [Endobacter medicaginis]|uniref:Beta-galactosidase n=3 Tax=Endobacter medicaginis TaxID=1181271 RepID=A0A839UWN5_9PROT|nr:beta-galactosidase [Endobacter medicaginis]MBB3173075.1 beta-galactosidase [Endobacter medicaginis]MCX5474500.1 beta-galactosidase [Endobacter medicaginis]